MLCLVCSVTFRKLRLVQTFERESYWNPDFIDALIDLQCGDPSEIDKRRSPDITDTFRRLFFLARTDMIFNIFDVFEKNTFQLLI